jgi:hypothetical protein
MSQATNSGPALDGTGVLMWRFLEYLSNKRPSAQERLGTKRLDEARDLAQKNEAFISHSDMKVARDKLLHASDVREGLESKSGLSKYLRAQEFKRIAKDALQFVKTVSDRTKSEMLGQRPVGLNPMLTTSDGGIDIRLCIEVKPKVTTLVEHRYHFNTSKAPESIRSNVELAKMLLRDMNFIYPEARDGGKRHRPYRHPIIQEAINLTLFRNKDDVGVVYHEHFSPMPIPIIALMLTVVQCCIEEWSDGQRKDTSWDDEKILAAYNLHVSSLFSFQAQGPDRNMDVLCQLQCDLLKGAREHAGVPAYPITEPRGFSREPLAVLREERHQTTSPDSPPSYDIPDIVTS